MGGAGCLTLTQVSQNRSVRRSGWGRWDAESSAYDALSPVVSRALKTLGEDLAIARVRRRESQRQWAKRLGVSVPTLIRLEQGDPGVGLSV